MTGPDAFDVTAPPAWARLRDLAATVPSLSALLDDDADRFERMALSAPQMLVDLSRQRVTPEIETALLQLAGAADLDAARRALFGANRLNPTEGRAVLHTALRAPRSERIELDGIDVVGRVHDALDRVHGLARDVRDGHWRGAWGDVITDVVNIGIGGSALGPALVCEALGPGDGPAVHFLANVDGGAAEALLARLDPRRTLFIVASKSFGTLETKVNARTARAWFIERGGRIEDVARHFVAVSTNVPAAADFGLPEENLLPLWDWVGGRYSLFSPIGLPIAIAHGPERFAALLAGARAMDEHFRDAPLAVNAPVRLALAELWNQAFLDTTSLAVLPYSDALARLPDYLQQLEMESNGKSVRTDGRPVTTGTGTILWGNVGTTGQHAYHQLLHQGTQAFSAEFVLPVDPGHRFAAHHDWLVAHCLAQAEAFARGRDLDGARAALRESGLDEAAVEAGAPHRTYPGDHPSTTILLDDLGPASLGALVALHEHKVFTHGILWGINSFDQWGVELGKVLGDAVHAALTDPDDGATDALGDASTRGLLRHLRSRR